MRTTCEECGATVHLDVYDPGGDLIGAECGKCGYYVTRYTRKARETFDWL